MSKLDDGWVLVPKVPTAAMLKAALDESGNEVFAYTAPRESGVAVECDLSETAAAEINELLKSSFKDTFEAMIAAAPAPPAQSGAGEIERKLRGWCTDWNGAAMARGEPPRDGLHCDDLLDAADHLAEAEKVMEPFDAIASTKGGTPQGEKLRAVICAILEQTPNSDLGALNEFCRAILAASAWLERRRATGTTPK